MKTRLQPWTVAMEATGFTSWIYDHLHARTGTQTECLIRSDVPSAFTRI